MNLLTKTMPWIAGALMIAATTAFGDDKPCRTPQRRSFEQGQKVTKSQMMPGYNAPSRTDVRGSWDVFATGSFIYWQLAQDNMEVAFVDKLTNDQYTTKNQIAGTLTAMDFGFKPGFKVGLGLNYDTDDWESYAEYTRIHTSNSQTNAAPNSGLLLPAWGHPYVMNSNAYNSASEKWNCNLDFVDLDLARSYYVGTQLTFRPFFGARAAFITQNVHAQYVNTSFSNPGTLLEVPGVMDVYQRNHSWAIGPRTGVNTNWMLGQGIRFFGNVNGDVLYTKYKIQNKSTFIATSTVGNITKGQNQYVVSEESVMALRTHVDMELGLGWGSYFDNNNWHVDLSAAYGFQAFFDQNMFTFFSNGSMPGLKSQPQGNLYAQGLTATVRFDF